MKQNIENILISPGNVITVLLEDRVDIVIPADVSHPCHVHQHYTRVDTKCSIVWMPCKSIVPSNGWDLSFWGQGS